MQKQIKWTAGSGQKIVIGLSHYGKKLNISGTIDGRHVAADKIETTDHPVAVAKFGAIGMTQENYDRVLAAIEEVKARKAAFEANRSTEPTKAQPLDIEKYMAFGEPTGRRRR